MIFYRNLVTHRIQYALKILLTIVLSLLLLTYLQYQASTILLAIAVSTTLSFVSSGRYHRQDILFQLLLSISAVGIVAIVNSFAMDMLWITLIVVFASFITFYIAYVGYLTALVAFLLWLITLFASVLTQKVNILANCQAVSFSLLISILIRFFVFPKRFHFLFREQTKEIMHIISKQFYFYVKKSQKPEYYNLVLKKYNTCTRKIKTLTYSNQQILISVILQASDLQVIFKKLYLRQIIYIDAFQQLSENLIILFNKKPFLPSKVTQYLDDIIYEVAQLFEMLRNNERDYEHIEKILSKCRRNLKKLKSAMMNDKIISEGIDVYLSNFYCAMIDLLAMVADYQSDRTAEKRIS